MNLYAVKGKKGEIYIRIEATDIEIKGTGELKTIKIPILKFLELEEKLDELLFGENNSIRVKHLNRIVPLIGKEEIHELLFHVPYTDGYPITKAFSMKVELEITRRIETSNPMTYEEIIDLMSKTLGTGRNWSENTWL